MTREEYNPDRFWSHVDKSSDCWVWTAATYHDGYGVFGVQVNGRQTTRRAHRIAYTEIKGEIPEGLVLDHLCRNRICVNPDHLEAVTVKENTLRGESPLKRFIGATHCDRGHPFDTRNTYTWTSRQGETMRKCRACGRDNARRYRESKRHPE